MLRVLHLRTSTAFWGPDRQILQLLRPLRERGIMVDVLVIYRGSGGPTALHPLVRRACEQGADADQVIDFNPLSRYALVGVARRMGLHNYHVVHTHEYKSNLLGGWCAWRLGLPAVASVRGYTDRTLPLRVYKWLDLSLTLRVFTRIVTVSDAVRAQVLRFGYPPDRVLTLHDAVDLAMFSPEKAAPLRERIREELVCTPETRLLCTVGRLSPEKGYHFLLDAFRQVVAAVPEARLIMVGDGLMRHHLEAQTVMYGLGSHVVFTGYRSDVEAVIAASDILVMPSLREGFGDPAIEAMALCVPVIGSSVGGIVEIVRHGETGLLVPPANPDALAEAIIGLLQDSTLRRRMGLQGRQVALQEYSVERLADALAELYEELVSRP